MKTWIPALLPVLLPALHAQDSPPELTALRSAFYESIQAGDRSVMQRFAASLEREESACAAAGDYATALRLRELGETCSSSAGVSDGRQTWTMDFAGAKNKGSGLASPESSGSVKFSSSGAFLEWELSGEFKGWYEVRLTHGVEGRGDHTAEVKPVAGALPAERKSRASEDDYGPKTGGWVSFEKISTLDRGNTSLHREIVSTGGWNTMRRVSLGRMEIASGSARLRLTGRDTLSGGLMNFRRLELVPANPPAANANSGEQELDAARKVFETQFASLTVETNKTYRDALTRMQAQQKDPDVLARIRRELARLTESPVKLAFAGGDDDGMSEAITLRAGSGIDYKVRGDVRFDSTKSLFTMLRPPGSGSVSWRLAAFSVPSGTYSVVVKGRVPVNGGGSAFLAPTGAGLAAGKALEVKVPPVQTPAERSKKPESGSSPPQPESRTVEAGYLVIPRGAEQLTLTVQSLTHQDGSLIDLSSVTLTRTGDVPAPNSK